jgi:FkbM family methyltransferase
VRFGPAALRRRWRELSEIRQLSSTWDGLRLSTWRRREDRPVEIACKYLNRKVWLRPATSDSDVFREVFGEREYEVACWDIKPKLIIDAGANIGLTSLYFADRCRDARIVAVEPEASNVDLLRRNTNDVRNITVKAGALWPRKASLVLVNDNAEKWAFSVTENSKSLSNVASFTMTDILDEVGSDCVDLLKLDIEGAEKELFTCDWEEWLPKVRRIVIELHDRLVPGCSRAFYSAILTRNFRQITHGQNVVIVFQDDAQDTNRRHAHIRQVK